MHYTLCEYKVLSHSLLYIHVGSDSSSDYNACVTAKSTKEHKGSKDKNFRTTSGSKFIHRLRPCPCMDVTILH